jgi:hypothetical protein
VQWKTEGEVENADLGHRCVSREKIRKRGGSFPKQSHMKVTTLVLGAGASKPYGFPTGYELRKSIIGELQGKQQLSTSLRDLYAQPRIDAFMVDFERSGICSIDRFLAERPEHEEVGKAAIAIRLMRNETMEALFYPSNLDDWYQYLWNRVATSWDALKSANLRVITFNYDRSLEYFLLEAASHTFGRSYEQCNEQLRNIPILHVYGLIGETHLRGYDCRAYEPSIDANKVGIATAGLQLMPKERKSDDLFERAWTMIDESHVICFLGFGYDPINLDRLGMPKLVARFSGTSHGKRIYGSTLGLIGKEVVTAANSCAGYVEDFQPLNCERTLRTHGILL